MEKVRIQKIIADSGLCSRRKAEELIEQGRVKVNGKIVGEATPDAVKTVFWKDVGLKDGENEIEVSAGGFMERAKWKLEKPKAEDPRMNPPPRPTPAIGTGSSRASAAPVSRSSAERASTPCRSRTFPRSAAGRSVF